jgi:hypothetical protein
MIKHDEFKGLEYHKIQFFSLYLLKIKSLIFVLQDLRMDARYLNLDNP